MVNLVDLGVRLSGFRFQFCLFLAGCPMSIKLHSVVGIDRDKPYKVLNVVAATTLGIPLNFNFILLY